MFARAALFALLLGAALASPSWAHGLFLELREAAPGEVVGEVYFSDGSPPGQGSWHAFRGADERPFARGELAPGGRLRFRIDGPGSVRVVVEEPGLHRCEATIQLARGASATSAEERGAEAPLPAPTPAEAASGSAPGRGGVPWTRLALGLGVIAALGGGLTLWQRRVAPARQ